MAFDYLIIGNRFQGIRQVIDFLLLRREFYDGHIRVRVAWMG